MILSRHTLALVLTTKNRRVGEAFVQLRAEWI